MSEQKRYYRAKRPLRERAGHPDVHATPPPVEASPYLTSKDPNGPALTFGPAAWSAFVGAIRH